MKRIPVLPSLVTIGNVVCGFTAIGYAAHGSFGHAAWYILFAMVFDALDGKIARLTRATSDFGAQLDSLADVITFGIAPALLVKTMIEDVERFPNNIGWGISALYVICTTLRLARFNVETEESEESHQYFKGLPSPAAAGLIASLAIFDCTLAKEHDVHIVAFILPFVTLAVAALMISRVRYMHLLNTLFRRPRPFGFLSQLIFLGVFVALTQEVSLCLAFGAYAASGVIGAIRSHATAPAEAGDAAEEEEDTVFF